MRDYKASVLVFLLFSPPCFLLWSGFSPFMLLQGNERRGIVERLFRAQDWLEYENPHIPVQGDEVKSQFLFSQL